MSFSAILLDMRLRKLSRFNFPELDVNPIFIIVHIQKIYVQFLHRRKKSDVPLKTARADGSHIYYHEVLTHSPYLQLQYMYRTVRSRYGTVPLCRAVRVLLILGSLQPTVFRLLVAFLMGTKIFLFLYEYGTFCNFLPNFLEITSLTNWVRYQPVLGIRIRNRIRIRIFLSSRIRIH